MTVGRTPRRGRPGGALAALVALAVALPVPAAATAGTVTIGAQMTQRDTVTVAFSGPTTIAVPITGEPASATELKSDFVSPVDGVIRRWRLAPQPNPGGLYALRVLRPTGNGSYTATATSQSVGANPAFTLTYATGLPIQAGDLIGLDILAGTPSPSVAAAGLAGAEAITWFKPDLFDGETRAPDQSLTAAQPTFDADVEAAPRIVLVTPSAGSSTGGTTVKIAGRNFGGVTGVSFGGVAASAFTVDSEELITATAPPSPGTGPVDVTVTTAAGTSRATSAGQFTYTAPPAPPAPPPPSSPLPTPVPGCVVPRLIGDHLVTARRHLARAGCRLGRITGTRRQTARVVRQFPAPGAIRPRDTAVNVRLVLTPHPPH
ncbi:MAG: IPT/TIG domain-containing protein [Actinobacteria bacterium]|nr:IPT/TIG domain-containing protein [Actinomycetota bacterium]